MENTDLNAEVSKQIGARRNLKRLSALCCAYFFTMTGLVLLASCFMRRTWMRCPLDKFFFFFTGALIV